LKKVLNDVFLGENLKEFELKKNRKYFEKDLVV